MDYFLLDERTGELRTAKPLDREALNDSTGLISLLIRVGICKISLQSFLLNFPVCRLVSWWMVFQEMIISLWPPLKLR